MLSLGTIFATITGAAAKAITGPFLDKIVDVVGLYINKQITKEQLAEKLSEVVTLAFADIEKTTLETTAKTYESFMATVRVNPEIARMVQVVVYSQTFVLFWSQVIVPGAHWLKLPVGVWQAGTTAEWAYLLIGGLCGAPMLLRAGPGGGAGLVADQLKRLAGR